MNIIRVLFILIMLCPSAMLGQTDIRIGQGQTILIQNPKDTVILNLNEVKPKQNWCTYYGGNKFELAFGLCCAGDKIILAGRTESKNSEQIAFGSAWQANHAGDQSDALLAAFEKDGKILWGTYLGGEKWDVCRDVTAGPDGRIYVTGMSSSKSVMGSQGAHREQNQGGDDSFLACFDQNGQRLWGTYYGGNQNEHAHCVITDNEGNIYISGRTASNNNNNNIASPDAHQTSLGGNGDAFLAKFSPDGRLLWSTYYGGKQTDTGKGIAIAADGGVILYGMSESNNAIATDNAEFSSHIGGMDAMIIKFSAQGQRLWSGYWGGNSDEHPYDVVTDDDGNIYICGETESGNLPVSDGAYQPDKAGNSDAYLAKLSASGETLWATYIGGSGFDDAWDLKVSDDGIIYVTGSTKSTNKIAGPNALQSQKGNSGDCWYAAFDSNGNKLYSSYFGGNGEDFSYCTALDDNNNLYLTGKWTSSDMGTPGVHQSNIGGDSDTFIASFDFGGSGSSPRLELLSPVDGFSTSADSVLFVWNDIDGVDLYTLNVLKDNEALEIVISEDINGIFYVIHDMAPGAYLAIVLCTMPDDETELVSDTVHFEELPQVPNEAPELIYPIDKMADAKNPLVFEWTNVESATYYNIIIRNGDEEVTETIESGQQSGNIKYEYQSLVPDAEYQWQVEPGNETGSGPISAAYTFTTAPDFSVLQGGDDGEVQVRYTNGRIYVIFPDNAAVIYDISLYTLNGNLIFTQNDIGRNYIDTGVTLPHILLCRVSWAGGVIEQVLLKGE